MANFDWQFNAPAINRTQLEELASAAFLGRKDNLVLVGQSGVGKSHIVEAVGRSACALGYRVRYTTSAGLIEDLTAALADQTLPRQVRYYAHFDLLIVDEFGFDRLERREARDAASLLFKVIDARVQKRSTALVTNIDFDAWGEYLGDPPLAMALLDRIVDGAIIVKIQGKSYRAARAQPVAKFLRRYASIRQLLDGRWRELGRSVKTSHHRFLPARGGNNLRLCLILFWSRTQLG